MTDNAKIEMTRAALRAALTNFIAACMGIERDASGAFEYGEDSIESATAAFMATEEQVKAWDRAETRYQHKQEENAYIYTESYQRAVREAREARKAQG